MGVYRARWAGSNCDVESLIFTALGDGMPSSSISVVREMSGCCSRALHTK